MAFDVGKAVDTCRKIRLDGNGSQLPGSEPGHTHCKDKQVMLVLMIDDDQDFVTVWRHILLQQGFDVAAVTSVAGAKRFLAHKNPDVIMCDANVSDLHITGFCSQLTGSRANQPAPIIITGEIGNARLRKDFLRRGAFFYLPKPFKRDELMHALQRVLSQQRRGRQPSNDKIGRNNRFLN